MFKNLLICSALLISSYAFCSIEKIAYVDFQLALESVGDGVKAKEKLEKEKNEKQKALLKKQADIKKMYDEYQNQSAVLSDKAKMQKERAIQEETMKYQKSAQEAYQELQAKQATLSKPIMDSLRSVISDIAKEKKYDLVFEKSTGGILFAKEADNITNSVIERYNKIHSGGK